MPQFVVLAATRAVGAVCIFVVSIIITRTWGAGMMAHYSLYLASASIASVILPVGFHAVASMLTAEYRARHKYSDQAAFIRYAQRLIFVMSLGLSPIALIVILFFPENSEYDIVILTLLAVPSAIAMAFTYFNAASLIGMQKQFAGHLPDTIGRPIMLLVGMACLAFFVADASVFQVLMISFTAITGATLIQWAGLRKALEADAGRSTSPVTDGEKAKWWKLAPSWVVITILSEYFVEVHLLVAAALIAPEEIALLYICFRLRQLISFGFTAMESLLLPKVFAANANGDQVTAQNYVRLISRLSLLYTALAFIIVAIAGPYFLAIFGEEFRSGQPVLLLVTATLVVRAIFGPAVDILGMSRHSSFVAGLLAVSLVISLIVALAGFQFGGVIMIAAGYLAASLFTAIAMWIAAKKKSGIDCAVWAAVKPAE